MKNSSGGLLQHLSFLLCGETPGRGTTNIPSSKKFHYWQYTIIICSKQAHFTKSLLNHSLAYGGQNSELLLGR
ncbi:uncharacterized protein K460DRAFT_368427 [Cucurbitaria berberidis CBS 394.84]|uniref:Uncharacterized protein n=1 Tax=Cucurbitaria berberidis CBS 394.84 TaxID=1168544 RepID=A0A9P4GDF0_9PLEO|nr:uncharacterized protein K460DRAFT_368427 [Cucurbitaria berberidis CBS 394.84]KAF1843540.1 hypothetical protein K460DRAFT_368427 [Cucurbitaria berberidis CBS 394.84]